MRGHVIEINGRDKISLPIVKFPPFNLRAAMVEKDPVIWLHLLEVYVKYLNYITYRDNLDYLDDQTIDYLRVFIRSYLHEMSDEEGKLLSLGANHDVLAQLKLLRAYVFNLIKHCGLLYLQISTKEAWDMVRVFVKGNLISVQKLLNGTLRPTINTQKAQLNRTIQIQQNILHLIESNQFTRVDLKALETLLEATQQEGRKFADEFVTVKWVESLESMFGKEPGSYLSEWGKKLGVLSFLSCSTGNIRSLFKEMHIENLKTLSLYPLMGSILIDKNFQSRVPDIKAISFLNSTIDLTDTNEESPIDTPSEEEKDTLKEMLPHLADDQISKLLTHYGKNLEALMNDFLEDPSLLESTIAEASADKGSDEPIKSVQTQHEREASLPVLSKSDLVVRQDPTAELSEIPDNLKNRNLARALALLYDANDDERDDTYDDAEVKQPTSERVNVANEHKPNGSEVESEHDRIEGYLWELLKRDKSSFTRQARKTKLRKDMRANTKWTDEQIEGWSRMIEKSPKRAQLLEEKYIFKGNFRRGKTSYVKNQKEYGEGIEEEPIPEEKKQGHVYHKSSGMKKDNSKQNKMRKANNEKNKASRANHNRKSGYDKKVSRISDS